MGLSLVLSKILRSLDPDPTLVQAFQEIILQKHTGSSWENSNSLDEGELLNNTQSATIQSATGADEEETVLNIGMNSNDSCQQNECSASRESWYRPVIQATEYMYFTLDAARTKRDVKTVVPDWVNVAREYVTSLPKK